MICYDTIKCCSRNRTEAAGRTAHKARAEYDIMIAERDGRIIRISFAGENMPDEALISGGTPVSGGSLLPAEASASFGVRKRTRLLTEAAKQLEEYFRGERKEFDLPLSPEGTPFQQRVWEALQTIPYGETRSYQDIARQIGNEKACRAVGMANNHNPIGIVIPCHRVIGKNGGLTGYAGGLDRKEFLLELERTVQSQGNKTLACCLREEITALADEKYRAFQSRLLPDTENFAGVRLPELRRLAKRIARENGAAYLETSLDREPEDMLFEEIMLQGMIIGYMKEDISGIFSYTERFLPRIGNWSVCDSFCSGWKHVEEHREQVWDWLSGLLESEREFTIRFAVVMLLDYYIDEDHIERLFPLFDGIRDERYYVRMAVAWAVSVCYVRYPAATMAYLRDNKLDDFTYHKALQKIVESRYVTEQQRAEIRKMKRAKQ